MHKNQWDIYKLDPAYHCVVHKFSQPSVITLAPIKERSPSPAPETFDASYARPPRTSKRYTGKRPRKTPSRMVLGVSMTKARKMPSCDSLSDETDSSEEESDDMKVDTRTYLRSERVRNVRNDIKASRMHRRERWKKFKQKWENTMEEEPKPGGGVPEVPKGESQPSSGMSFLILSW